jgi:hypothetical protein
VDLTADCSADSESGPALGPAKGWPHTPPNYIAFRFDGRLQQVRHVDRYEVVTRPHDYIPEIIPQADWSDEPHFLYTLGPPIVPRSPCSTGRSGRTQGCGAPWTCC